MSKTYYTQPIAAGVAGLTHDQLVQAAAPYMCFDCREAVDLNFLFREVLYVDPESVGYADVSNEVIITKEFATDATWATQVANDELINCAANSQGNKMALRILNALTSNAVMTADCSSTMIVDPYATGLGGSSTKQSDSSANSVFTNTFELVEFLQVLTSIAVIQDSNQLETNKEEIAYAGLVDREVVNLYKLLEDFNDRKIGGSGSDLVGAFMASAKQNNTYTNATEIQSETSMNWMKNLVRGIVLQQGGTAGFDSIRGDNEAAERSQPLRRKTAQYTPSQERYHQIRLKDDDCVVFVFKPMVVRAATGTNLQPVLGHDGTSHITIGLKVKHTGNSSLVKTPVGWETTV